MEEKGAMDCFNVAVIYVIAPCKFIKIKEQIRAALAILWHG